MSRNTGNKSQLRAKEVTSREGRVSRNEKDEPNMERVKRHVPRGACE